MQTAAATKTAPPRASKATPAPITAAVDEMYPMGYKPAAVTRSTVTQDDQTDETPETLFAAAVRAINKRYQLGTQAHIEDHAPDLAARLALAFDRLNDAWAATVPGAGLGKFKRALRTWYELNLDAMKEYEDYQNER